MAQVVVMIGTRRFDLSPRLADIVALLIQHEQTICRQESCAIELTCGRTNGTVRNGEVRAKLVVPLERP